MPYVCDGLSVGVLIFDEHNRMLMITRANAPVGIAPVAGHVRDENPEYTHADAAVVETEEEVGLTVAREGLVSVYSRWHANRCGAQVPAPSLGHDWGVFRAKKWSGQVQEAPDEVKAAHWYDPDQVQALADRTVSYAHGLISEDEWQRFPGLEPVWVDIFSITPAPGDPGRMMVNLPDPRDLGPVRDLYSTPPV